MDIQNTNFLNSNEFEVNSENATEPDLIVVSNNHDGTSHTLRLRSKSSSSDKSIPVVESAIANNHSPSFESRNCNEDEDNRYKSPTVLSFDAYGNLTSSDDPDAPYSHEVPSLAEFDYILDSFEGKLKKEYSTKPTPIKKQKSKVRKSTEVNGNSLSHSNVNLKEAFKKEFDTSVSVTSRYGRTRKQKAQDGFLFGTINFNQLRKITSSSPKKSRLSSASEGRSDSEGNDLEEHPLDIAKNFEPLSDNISGYSSEDEFASTLKNQKSKTRHQTLPPNLGKSTKAKEESRLIHKKYSSKKHSTGTNKKKRRSDAALGNSSEKFKKGSSEDENATHKSRTRSQSINKNLDSELYVKNEVLSPNISRSFEETKSTEKEVTNIKLEPVIGPIQDDINIIKSSLSVPKNGRFSPLKEMPDLIMDDSNDDGSLYESNKKGAIKEENVGHQPEIIQMETLNDEVKQEELPKTKFGRQVKKPDIIDISALRRKSSIGKPKNQIEAEHSSIESAIDNRKLEKECPRNYFIGDLVWVLMKGNPLWPGMVTYPKDDTEYTRIVTASGGRTKRIRQYHIQFFYDNFQTSWVPGTRLIIYEGLEKLKSHVEFLKESLKSDKHFLKDAASKNLLKNYSKISGFMQRDKNNHSKTLHWYQALEEGDRALVLDRYQRIELFKPVDYSKRTEEDPQYIPKKRKYHKISSKRDTSKDETASNKSKSSDDFSGFDDDSMSEKRKIKRMKLEKRLAVGDFEVYLQKHLHTSVNDLHMSEERARKLLEKRWKKLTPLQRSRYKSKICHDSAASSEAGGSDTGVASVCSTKPRKMSHDDGVDIAKGTYRIPKNEKVCFNCEDVSSNNGSDMVKCKGVCGGCFHQKCVGLNAAPKNDFKCAFCLSGVHRCFVCKSSEGEKFKCSVTFCGKFYHSQCVNGWPQTSKSRQSEKLVCPRHVCHMCAAHADDMNDMIAKTPPFTRCLKCPTAYHTGETCIAAGSEEVTQHYHICPKHMKVPKNNSHHFNVNWCFCCSKGGSLLLCDQCPAAFHAECLNITAPEGSYVCEDCENGKFPVYGDIVWVKLGSYRWWPGEVLHPRHIPDNIENLSHTQGMFCVHFFGSDDYYWVSRGRTFHYQEGDQGSKYSSSKFLQQKFHRALEDAVVAYRKQKEKREMQERNLSLKGALKPAPYVKIDTNKPVGNVRLGKLDTSTVTKCDCDPYSENPCGSDDKCINRMLMVECIREVCPAKERCNNQRFQKRQYPNVFPFKTSGRGWGLKTKDFIKKGDFVIEYVGELIDDSEFRRRIDKMHEYKEDNYYFLTVEPDRLIDAGPKGNLARFMNHCCQPNCETQKWTVGADTRVGLFALEDIPEATEVTFNYNLLCVGTDKKKCNCEAPNCSGFIGAKVQKADSSAGKKSKLENGGKKKKIKKRKSAKREKDWENECFRCSNPGNLILCDLTTCPKGYHLECLGLKDLPKGKWLCPWHHCDDCGVRSGSKCVMCPNSFCKQHAVDKFHTHPGFTDICRDHEAEQHLEARSEGSGSSVSVSGENIPETIE